MPATLVIGFFTLGAILLLIGILGGNFKIFGAEVASSVSNPFIRFLSFVFGIIFIGLSLSNNSVTPKTKSSDSTASSKPVILPPCPSVGGKYQRDRDQLVMTISQNSCTINGSFAASNFDHQFKGDWQSVDNSFSIALTRTDIYANCVVHMSGTIAIDAQKNIKLIINSTGGGCDVPANFSETSIFANIN